MGLWHNFEMAVGSGRSTPGSEIRKRIEEISIICHQSWRQRLMAGCLSLSLFRSMFCCCT